MFFRKIFDQIRIFLRSKCKNFVNLGFGDVSPVGSERSSMTPGGKGGGTPPGSKKSKNQKINVKNHSHCHQKL